MNRLTKLNTVKILYLLCLTIGFCLLFFEFTENVDYQLMAKAIGIVLVMYGLSQISRKLIRDPQENDNEAN